MVAAKATAPNAVRKAFIVVSFMDQTFVNRIDLATVAAFEETLCEANHIKPAPGGTKMSRRATTAAVRPRVLRRVLANRSRILQKEPEKIWAPLVCLGVR
jgi:hypothetical protein